MLPVPGGFKLPTPNVTTTSEKPPPSSGLPVGPTVGLKLPMPGMGGEGVLKPTGGFKLPTPGTTEPKPMTLIGAAKATDIMMMRNRKATTQRKSVF